MLTATAHDLAEYMERLVSPHISRLVRQTPNYVTFEAKSHADALRCVELLQPHRVQIISVAGASFVLCSLST